MNPGLEPIGGLPIDEVRGPLAARLAKLFPGAAHGRRAAEAEAFYAMYRRFERGGAPAPLSRSRDALRRGLLGAIPRPRTARTSARTTSPRSPRRAADRRDARGPPAGGRDRDPRRPAALAARGAGGRRSARSAGARLVPGPCRGLPDARRVPAAPGPARGGDRRRDAAPLEQRPDIAASTGTSSASCSAAPATSPAPPRRSAGRWRSSPTMPPRAGRARPAADPAAEVRQPLPIPPRPNESECHAQDHFQPDRRRPRGARQGRAAPLRPAPTPGTWPRARASRRRPRSSRRSRPAPSSTSAPSATSAAARINNVRFGRYCSVASGVVIGPHEHPTDWLTTSRIAYYPEVNGWDALVAGPNLAKVHARTRPFHRELPDHHDRPRRLDRPGRLHQVRRDDRRRRHHRRARDGAARRAALRRSSSGRPAACCGCASPRRPSSGCLRSNGGATRSTTCSRRRWTRSTRRST